MLLAFIDVILDPLPDKGPLIAVVADNVPVTFTPEDVVASLELLLWYRVTAPLDVKTAWFSDSAAFVICTLSPPRIKSPVPISFITESLPS